MKNDVQRLGDYLAHLLEAIERVQRYTEGMVESVFLNSPMVQDAVVRNFEVIGEASKNIEKHYPQFVARHPELPFAPAYQMRNSLAHGYFKVDFEIVWKTIHSDFPTLHAQITVAKSTLPGNGDDEDSLA